MGSRIPPLLEAYLRLPPEASLVLLTGVLGSSTNWLVQRYLYSLLQPSPTANTANGKAQAQAQADDDGVAVLLVSFLRDYAFWRDGVGRLGLDLDAAARRRRLVYVDALGALFQPEPEPGPGARGPPVTPPSGPAPGGRVLSTPTVEGLRRELEGAVAQLRPGSSSSSSREPGPKIVLVVDQPDLLLAAAGDGVYGQALHEMLLDIRENVHSTVVTLSADEPLISAQTTLLEKEHAAFTLSVAHDAHLVMGLRMLDTGTAKDVSGVIRITAGGQHDEEEEAGDGVEERELLYFVGGDGAVRVFERGQ